MCGELVVQTSFIAFKSNSKWHEEFMRVVGFVKLRTLMEYVMEFVPLFLVAISAAGKLHLSREREIVSLLDGDDIDINGIVLVDPSVLRDKALIRCAFTAGISAAAVPCLTGIPYFLFATIFLTSWGLSDKRKLVRPPAFTLVIAMAYACVHFMIIMCYQFPQLHNNANKTFASWIGLYIMDGSEGSVVRGMRLIQLFAIAGFFSSTCEASANEDIVDEVQYTQDGSMTEGLDDIDEPLLSPTRGSDRETSSEAVVDPGVSARLLAKFSGVIAACTIILASITAPSAVAYPILLFSLMCVLYPPTHREFSKLIAPSALIYVALWSFIEFIVQAIPGTDNNSFFLLLGLSRQENDWIGSLRMASVFIGMTVLAYFSRFARRTPNEVTLQAAARMRDESLPTSFIFVNSEYDNVDYDFDEDGFTPSESGWAGVAASFASKLLIPLLLWLVALSRDDIIHAGLFCLFLLTIAKPGKSRVLKFTSRVTAMLIAVMYLWSLDTLPVLLGRHRFSKFEDLLQIIGLWNKDVVRSMWPLALVLFVDVAVVHMPGIIRALSHLFPSEVEEEEEEIRQKLSSDGSANNITENNTFPRRKKKKKTLPKIKSLIGAIMSEFWLSSKRVLNFTGAYSVLLIGLFTVLTNKCSLLNLALLLFLGGALVVPFDTIEDRNRRSVRWGALFTFALINLAVRYAFGAFPLAQWVGMNSQVQDFMANNVGLEPNLPRNKLMTSLLGPSLLLVATHFHRIGLLRSEPMSLSAIAQRQSEQPIRLVIVGTQKGRIPMLKRICILHCDKFLTFVALGFSLQRGVDVIGALMLLALICTFFSPKLARTSEILGAVAILTALLEYTYNIDWIHRALSGNEETMAWVGARYYSIREEDSLEEDAIWVRNERMLLWPVFVLVAVEFCRISRNWLVKLPPALKSGCAPEPCHLFWPPRNPEARSATLKRAMTKKSPFRRMETIYDDHELISEDVNSDDEGTSTTAYSETYLSGDRSESLRARAKRLLFQKARTSIDQLSSLVFILPEFVEGALALLMPGLAYVIFGTVGIASGNILSLIYLGLMLQLMEKEHISASPSNRLKAWKLVSFVCGVALFWQYIASMGEYPKENEGNFAQMSAPPPPAVNNNNSSSSSSASLGSKTEREYEADELLIWFALVKRSKYMLIGHFLAFFVAVCQLRMDSVLASMEERARTAVIAENPDLEEEHITQAATMMLPRRTPTQLALLPRRPGDPTLKIFSALTWEATTNWTIIDWTRYYVVRYSREVAFILVIVAGTCMNDVIHAGYLLLSISILRNRTWDKVDELLLWMKRYNLLIMGSVLAYQAPFESLVGAWFANRGNVLCSFLHIVGFYRVDSVLGFSAGQLGPDLLIFATMSCLRYLINSHEYAAVLEMDRQARSRTKTGDKADTWKRVRKYYLQCLKAMKEREERHKRVEEIRNDIQNLSLEVVRLENMQQKDIQSSKTTKKDDDDEKDDVVDDSSLKTPTGISASKLRSRKVGGARPKIDDWVEEQAKTPSRETPWEGIDRSFAGSETIGVDSELFNSDDGDASDFIKKKLEDDDEKIEDLIEEFIRGDRKSVFGFIIAGVIDVWPWISAPEGSCVYFFYFLAFAMNFSLITVIYPTALICAALIASPKPGPKFWRFMLRYSESVIILSYILSIPCSKACFSWKVCGRTNILGVPDFSKPFVISTLPLFLAYFATLLHSFGQGGVYELKPRYHTWLSSTYVPTEDVIDENNVLDEAIMEDDDDIPQSLSRNRRRKMLPDFENLKRSGSLHSRDWFQNASKNLDTFFQRLLTDETEFGPSFISISILDTEDHTEDDWTKIGNDLNFALLQLQDYENANNSEYYSIDLVETDVKGALSQKGHRTAVFQVVAPLSLLTPATDAANGVKKLQLREASSDFKAMPELPGITSVRAFHREPENFYGITASLDIIAAVFALFFYQSSIEADPQALIETVSQGLFPQDYVFTMFVILVLIIVDAVIYLKKAKAAKVFYHYSTFAFFTTGLLILYHKSTTSNHKALRVFFFIKCLSFATSARQLRCGYPIVINESLSWLKRRNEEIASILFGIYYSIPFLYELKVLLDFACTASSLDIFDWLKLEDINRSLFEIDIRNKTYYKRYPFGKPQPTWKKVYLEGGGLFVLLFAALIIPFFVFSTSNPQVGINPVLEAGMNITFVSPNSTSSFQVFVGGNRRTIQTEDWMNLNTDSFTPPPVRHPSQIQDACLSPDSDQIWALPPPAMKDFSNSIAAGTKIVTYWNFRRALPLDNKIVSAGGKAVVLEEKEANVLKQIINGDDESVFFVKGLYPRVWRILGKGDPVREISTNQFVDCSFKLNGFNTTQPWWSVKCGVNVKSLTDEKENIFWEQCKDTGSGPEIILISSEVATGVFAQFSKIVGGLTGMYVAYILAIGTFIRGMTSGLVNKIPHADLPCTRRLTALCEDIYVMRNAGEHVLEERLYWLLIRIYRSPTVLFEFTRTERGEAEPERPLRKFGK